MTVDQAEPILRQTFMAWLEMRKHGVEPHVVRASADAYEAFELHYLAFVHLGAPHFAGVVFRTAAVICEPDMARGTVVLQ